jgi:hypothetical protein
MESAATYEVNNFVVIVYDFQNHSSTPSSDFHKIMFESREVHVVTQHEGHLPI